MRASRSTPWAPLHTILFCLRLGHVNYVACGGAVFWPAKRKGENARILRAISHQTYSGMWAQRASKEEGQQFATCMPLASKPPGA